MADKDDIDMKIDECLEILQDDNQANSAKGRMKIRNEDGSLNDDARAKLVSNITDIKEDRENRKTFQDTMKGKEMWMVKQNDYQGTSVDRYDAPVTYKAEGRFLKTRKAYVYMPTSTPATAAFVSDFRQLLQKMSVTVDCNVVHQTSTLQHDAPLIVVCPVLSRLEPDIDHALQGLKWPVRFAVVLLNIARENSLPRLPIETRMNTKQQKYENIEFIDVAYTPEDHMYSCNMNNNAKNRISGFMDSMYGK